ncbi:DUF1643 domain-containing protein [Paenibacillus sp. KR2-11]|uniref:DUF1643 domain-containing protein n=1 Tax=Paenibacillus sp. KR2-11 TaxID=3385500 RepID=UPI0038FC25A3
MTRKLLLSGILELPNEMDETEFREELLAWVEQRAGHFEPLFHEVDIQNVSHKVAYHSAVMGKEEEDFRFTLKKVWEPSKNEAGAIMMNPSRSTHLMTDETVKFLIEYLSQDKSGLNYGSLTVVNLSPVVKGSNAGDDQADFPPDDGRNSHFILEMIASAKIIIMGWGKVGQNQGVPNLSPEVIKALYKARSKLRVFALKKGRENSVDIWYPAHPKPQGGPNKGFKMDHELKKLTRGELDLLFK